MIKTSLSIGRKQGIIVLGLIFFTYLPNLYFGCIGDNVILNNNLKQGAYLLLTLALLVLPLGVLKPKIYFGLLFVLLPFFFLDLYLIIIAKNYSSPSYYNAVLFTNYKESKELILSNIFFFSISILALVSYILLWYKLSFKFYLGARIKYGLISICCLIIFTILIKMYLIRFNNLSDRSILKSTFEEFKISYLENSYPLGSLIKVATVIEGKSHQMDFDLKNKDFSYYPNVLSDRDQTIVLVIGETARRNNFSLYGYHRNTNPKLANYENLIVFEDVITNSSYTHLSFPMILSSAEPENFDSYLQEKGISYAFKEAGYKTYWITNQSYNPGTPYSIYSNQVEEFIDVSLLEDSESYDEKIIPVLKQSLNDSIKKRFIVIHTMGSHFNYTLRYPKSFAKFRPEIEEVMEMTEMSLREKGKDIFINSYDNTILYTDYVLSLLIETLKEDNGNSILLYLSDHGENLFDDERHLALHGGGTPTKYELEIPMLMWYSNEIDKEIIAKIKENSRNSFSSSIMFHSLSSLGGFRTRYHKNELDFLSDSLISEIRTFYLGDKKIINID